MHADGSQQAKPISPENIRWKKDEKKAEPHSGAKELVDRVVLHMQSSTMHTSTLAQVAVHRMFHRMLHRTFHRMFHRVLHPSILDDEHGYGFRSLCIDTCVGMCVDISMRMCMDVCAQSIDASVCMHMHV